MENKNQHNHEHCNCGHHHHEEVESENIDDFVCDLDDSKICDNCMKCLDILNTDSKGYVSIGIDGVDQASGLTLNDLYKMYGLDDEE